MKTSSRIANWILAASALAPLAANGQGKAPDAYPNKPIRFIVPFAPGGATDIVARMVGRELSASLGQSVVVDNRGGAGGAVGHELAVRAAPDGYTMAFVSGSYATSAALSEQPYDPVKDITPVILISDALFVIAVTPNFQAKTVGDLVAMSKAKPNSVSYGTTGVGGITHLAMELFDMMAGTKMVMVPYKGTAPAMTDVISGQIPMMVGTAPGVLPHMKTGRMRGLAVTSLKRSPSLPDIPAVSETVAGYEAVSWFAIWGPKGMSKPLLSLLNTELNKVLVKPEIKARIVAEAMDVRGGDPQVLGDFIAREIAKWKKVVKVANIKAQ